MDARSVDAVVVAIILSDFFIVRTFLFCSWSILFNFREAQYC
jgi:hypothetical protein